MPRRDIALGRLSVVVVLSIASVAALAHSAPLIQPKLVVWGYSGTPFNQPRGIAFDPTDGAIYVANTGEHRVDVFSRTGRPLSRFVHRVGRPDGTVVDGSPCALAFDLSGRLLVVDHLATYVDVLDRRGRPVTRLDVPAGHPNAVAIGPDGTIYVGTAADESRVYRFHPDYASDGSWGERGMAPGCLFNVTSLGVLPDSTVAVACARTDLVVQIFTPAGRYLRGFGVHDVGDGNFSMPSGLVATADGRIWVTDEIRQTLQVFDREGNVVGKTGGRGVAPGEFAHPSSLTSDGRGLIALTDREIGRVQVFAVSDE
jgi:DNA-binding beta-propeller fold protein YncE